MPVEGDANLEIRCFCRRAPLLAMCGRDTKTGAPFVHIKSARKDRINSEAIVTSGTVRVRCRDCLRWHTVNVQPVEVISKPERLPSSIDIS